MYCGRFLIIVDHHQKVNHDFFTALIRDFARILFFFFFLEMMICRVHSEKFNY